MAFIALLFIRRTPGCCFGFTTQANNSNRKTRLCQAAWKPAQLGWTRDQRSSKEMLSKNAVPSTTLPLSSFMIQA